MLHTPDASPLHPFATLTPDAVLDALASVGLYGDGRLMALSSYENRVYQVTLEDGSRVVAKFYRPGRWSEAQILEEHAFAAELMAAEVPAVGPLVLEGRTLHPHGGFQFSVSPWRGGRQPELDDFEVLEWTGRFLARIHAVGAQQPFAARPALDLRQFGTEPRNWLLGDCRTWSVDSKNRPQRGQFLPDLQPHSPAMGQKDGKKWTAAADLQPTTSKSDRLPGHELIPLDVQSAWRDACDTALDLIANGAQPAGAGGPFLLKDATPLRLHGDCHPGNILWTPLDEWGRGGPHFVDLDDARTGPAVQDLWMLLSGDRRQRTHQLGALLDGYEQFRTFDRRELALIEPLRTLRLIHYSAWLARRWEDPIFPINFPWFGTSDYWRGQVDMLHEQIEAMQEEPLVA